MANGYSVNEAASVLGIPEARVWELLARGVLAGVPEASGGMRVVFADRESVQPAAAPPPPVNGGSHAELSPFRELLTEFRNLTERYGQALLALGESRGEVASLRSRVEVLEARLDLRLPGGPGPASGPISWQPPPSPVAEPSPEAVPPITPAPMAAVPTADAPIAAPATPRKRRSRAKGSRAAVAAFAEAMARANDPGTAVLPGALEAAEALAELRREQAAQAGAEATSPPASAVREPEPEPEPVASEFVEQEPVASETPEPAASADAAPPATGTEAVEREPVASDSVEPQSVEPEPVASETPEPPASAAAPLPGYSTQVVEPDWFADGDFTWLEAGQAVVTAVPDAEPDVAAAPPHAEGPVLADEVAAALEVASEPEPEAVPEVATEPEPVPEPAPALEAVLEVAAAPPQAEGPVLADEVAAALEVASEPEPEPVAEPTPEAVLEVAPEVVREAAPEAAREVTPAPNRPPLVAPISGPFGEEVIGQILPIVSERPQPESPFVRAGIRPATPPEPAAAIDSVRLSDDEFDQLAHDEGWDEAEIRAIRVFLGRPGDQPRRPAAARTPAPPAPGPPPAVERTAPAPERPTPAVAQRRSPAAGAFRRLRRLLRG